MFDFLKNKSINLVLDDLDNCMNYIIYSSPIKEDEVAQILNTIRHFITEIGNGNATEQEVQKHFMNMKTVVAHFQLVHFFFIRIQVIKQRGIIKFVTALQGNEFVC